MIFMKKSILKIELIKWITKIEDLSLLKTLKSIKDSNSNSKDWYYELNNEDKESILRGIKDVENGNVMSSEEFWKGYEDRIKLTKSR